MLLRWAIFGLLLTASAGLVRAEAVDDSSPIRTERREFSIPFDVDASLPDAERPTAVQLFVSPDRGQSWRLYEQVAAGKGSFRFEAPTTGEFWFVTRPVTAANDFAPLVDVEPELKVIVESAVVPVSAEMSLDEVPQGAELRMINSRVFDLDYDIPNLSRSATDSVELWRTTDGGKTWELHDRDVDRRSPMRVRVDGEGLYGFSLVIVAADGSSSARPTTQQQPQFWVGIDRTRPTGRLMTASTSALPSGQIELTVRWEADDARLAGEPIAIYYGESSDGPWTPLALSLVDTGEHTCSLPAAMPAATFLRLEVRDEAGNVHCANAGESIALGTPSTSGSGEVVTAARLYHVFH